MFQGRAGHMGLGADAGEELSLLLAELVVGGAPAPQPVGGAGVVEGIEAVLGLKAAAGCGVVRGSSGAAISGSWAGTGTTRGRWR
jgi:hypothetical protein